jgi:hypothetical protein
MSITSGLVGLVAVAAVAAVVASILKAGIATGASEASTNALFKAKALLTANELEFLGRLERAVPEYRFHAQVAMGALLVPAVSAKDAKAYYRARGMFWQKIIDFLAQSRADGSIVAVIELDDRTHDPEKDGKRDAMLASAGFRVVRWRSKDKPDAAAIRQDLVPVVVPANALPVASQSVTLSKEAA